MSVESVEKRLNDLLKEAKQKNSFEAKDAITKFLEEKNLRKPEILLDTGSDLLKNHSDQLGSRQWRLRERMYVAALDCERYREAIKHCTALSEKFPGSGRVLALQGLYHEARGKFKEATTKYKELLEDDPSNKMASVRLICCSVGLNKPIVAIKQLGQHLTLHQNDTDSWKTLAKLYMQLSQYDLAKFCLEEVLLHAPSDWRAHLLYADVLYTLGEYATAKKYYSQCLVLSPKNLRAMLGLDKCFSRIKVEDLSEIDKDLRSQCQIKLISRVANANSKMAPYFKSILMDQSSVSENAI